MFASNTEEGLKKLVFTKHTLASILANKGKDKQTMVVSNKTSDELTKNLNIDNTDIPIDETFIKDENMDQKFEQNEFAIVNLSPTVKKLFSSMNALSLGEVDFNFTQLGMNISRFKSPPQAFIKLFIPKICFGNSYNIKTSIENMWFKLDFSNFTHRVKENSAILKLCLIDGKYKFIARYPNTPNMDIFVDVNLINRKTENNIEINSTRLYGLELKSDGLQKMFSVSGTQKIIFKFTKNLIIFEKYAPPSIEPINHYEFQLPNTPLIDNRNIVENTKEIVKAFRLDNIMKISKLFSNDTIQFYLLSNKDTYTINNILIKEQLDKGTECELYLPIENYNMIKNNFSSSIPQTPTTNFSAPPPAYDDLNNSSIINDVDNI